MIDVIIWGVIVTLVMCLVYLATLYRKTNDRRSTTIIDGTHIVANSITADRISDSAITADRLIASGLRAESIPSRLRITDDLIVGADITIFGANITVRDLPEEPNILMQFVQPSASSEKNYSTKRIVRTKSTIVFVQNPIPYRKLRAASKPCQSYNVGDYPALKRRLRLGLRDMN